jgi:hypothetical protein
MRKALDSLRAEFAEFWTVYLGIAVGLLVIFIAWRIWKQRSKARELKATAGVVRENPAARAAKLEGWEEHFQGARQRIQAAIQEKTLKDGTSKDSNSSS